uniref:Carbohydrate kinase PfkB domain-containing protein n=1 Tax=Araucaria cunninghamii TaxID=56994 RepID=A0A0D6R665_ARACU
MAGGGELKENMARVGGKGTTLVVGNYCHDLLKLASGREVESLGGSVSYITNILDALGLDSTVVSKVGSDFKYARETTSHPPSAVLASAKTTQFSADFTAGNERVLRVTNACESIHPSDIPSPPAANSTYMIGLAVGVAKEIVPETLKRMVEVSGMVVADIQALIRTVDPSDGTVGLRNLSETEFYEFLEDMAFVKASTLEAAYVDLEEARKRTCLIVTEGKGGCTVYERHRQFHVPSFLAEEVDPTGAGDSFLAGFSAGLMRGLSVEDAALMGNFFGSLAVAHIGLPRFSLHHFQRLQEVFGGRIKNGNFSSSNMDCGQSPTLMHSLKFSNLPILEDKLVQEKLDKTTENSNCVSKDMDSVELGDFLSGVFSVENQSVHEHTS